MTCFELRAALDELHLSQRALARLCSVEAQQVWRWCDGRNPVPDYVAVTQRYELGSAIAGTAIGSDMMVHVWLHGPVYAGCNGNPVAQRP